MLSNSCGKGMAMFVWSAWEGLGYALKFVWEGVGDIQIISRLMVKINEVSVSHIKFIFERQKKTPTYFCPSIMPKFTASKSGGGGGGLSSTQLLKNFF